MDGHFIPNISIGIPVVESSKFLTTPFPADLRVSDDTDNPLSCQVEAVTTPRTVIT